MDTKMYTTRPFMSGRSQAVRIPKEHRFEDTELIVNRIGSSLVITPKNAIQEAFFSGLSMFTDDFLADGRPEEIPNQRVEL